MASSPPPRSPTGWRAFVDEARRREVHRALAIYGAVAWASITAAPDLIQWVGAPSWVFTALVVILLIGLPVVVWASWTLDFSVRTEEGGPGEPTGPELLTPADVERPGTRRPARLLALSLVLALLVAFPFAVRWMLAPDPGEALRVGLWGPAEARALLGPSLEWFLEARAVTIVPDEPSLTEALGVARRSGARYLVAVDAPPRPDAPLSATLYAADSGDRIVVLPGEDGPGSETGGRLALQLVRTLAREEGRGLPIEVEVMLQTASPRALLHLLEGRRHFGAADFDAAVASFERAVAADSTFVPAYYRLAVARQWRWTYDAGWDALEAAASRGRASPRWERLLTAGRRYLERDAAGALAAYELVTLHHPELREGWLGLGETLFHYGGVLGHAPEAARGPLEQSLEGDSLFAPVGHHLVELALWRGDGTAARSALRLMAPTHPSRPVLALAVELQDGTPDARRAAWEEVGEWDLRRVSLLVAHFGLDPTRRPLADSLAGTLLAPGRRPEERLRGAQYRLVLATDRAAWARALREWRDVRGGRPFDPWIVHAHHAGLEVPEAASMLEWAEEQRAAGRVPDFDLPLDHDLRRAFRALVHDAVLEGDSARVGVLLEDIARTPPGHPTDPGPPGLAAALRARNALLASDTAAAVEHLSAAVSRTYEPYVTFYPSATMAPERLLLIRLHRARGNPHLAEPWRRSFHNSQSFGDVLYTSWVDDVADAPFPLPQTEAP